MISKKKPPALDQLLPQSKYFVFFFYRTYSEFWLKRHSLRIHETEKHSACHFCDKTFVFKCEMEEHIEKFHPETGTYE